MTKRFILTGAPGSGKTPVIAELAELGIATVAEPARAVIAAQRLVDETSIYDRSPSLFHKLMLEKAVEDYARFDGSVPAVFDRAIPDLVAYADLFGLDRFSSVRAASEHRYNDFVFVLPSWPEIYTTDEDRRMTFEQAEAFGRMVEDVYVSLGYTLVPVPFEKPDVRARRIAASIAEVIG